MDHVDEKDVRREFEKHFSSGIADDVIKECTQLCSSFAETPENLVFKWMALSMNMGGGGMKPIDSVGVAMLRKELQKNLQKSNQPTKRAGPMTARRPQAPIQPRPSLPRPVRHPLDSIKTGNLGITIHDNIKDRSYRYMYERLVERSTVLDDRIDEFAEMVRVHYQLEEIGDPASTSDEEQIVVGRICCDEDVKLNDASVVLETSRLMGAGARVPLKFDPNVTINGNTTLCPIFPGAILAFKGKNETGEWFQVSQILTLPILTKSLESNRQVRPISMAVAAGPFSADADLSYAPFQNLMSQIRASAPSWLLLLGPFVDVNNAKVQAGDMDFSPLDTFRSKILAPLRAVMEEHRGMTVLILPSPRDLISNHAVFPQAPLHMTSERILFLPNPCTFTIDHVRFAASSVDILFHLQSQLLRKRVVPTEPAAKPDMMHILSSCILEQRSFYPLFPSYPQDVNLDISHSELLKIEDVAPDVLILPSNLKQFHKVVQGTAIINPSLASKGVHALVHIPDASTDGDSTAGERARVQLPSTGVSMNAALES
ncbi:DNA polymerase alpha, subunit B [Serendipita vermifera]|nr:DNA polymerase alpha, subunit B [Serendipita vermifera]